MRIHRPMEHLVTRIDMTNIEGQKALSVENLGPPPLIIGIWQEYLEVILPSMPTSLNACPQNERSQCLPRMFFTLWQNIPSKPGES